MTLPEFVDKWHGRYLHFLPTGVGSQCMDLANEYARDVLNTPAPLSGNAIDVWTHGPRPGYTLTANGPYNYPSVGDMVVWGSYAGLIGAAGHIAVVLFASSMRLCTYDQNFPTGSPCIVVDHDYRGVVGWLTRNRT